jgi:hypothetical protein
MLVAKEPKHSSMGQPALGWLVQAAEDGTDAHVQALFVAVETLMEATIISFEPFDDAFGKEG